MNILSKLNEYFKNTPEEKIREDWESTEMFDEVGITVEEFLEDRKYLTVLEYLDEHKSPEVVTGVCIFYKGKRIQLRSGKNVWENINNAKRALKYDLTHCEHWYRKKMDLGHIDDYINRLVSDGLIEFKSIKDLQINNN